MIARENMFDPLLEADPSFTDPWNAFVEDWKGTPPGELPHYLALADLARHLVCKLRNGDTHSFRATFGVVERWLVEGERYVREAATVGLLENLQNTNIHDKHTEPKDFLVWLGPKSRLMWDKVEAFWRDGTIITDDD